MCAGAGLGASRFEVDTTVWPPKLTKCELAFADGTRLAVTNTRQLGRIRLQGAEPTCVCVCMCVCVCVCVCARARVWAAGPPRVLATGRAFACLGVHIA